MVVCLLPLALAIGWIALRARDPFFAYSDIAVLELSTHRALGLDQLVGPYSRFGWHHPGPAYFYVLAPFYLVSGGSTWGLYLGVAVIGGAAVAVVVRVAGSIAGASGAVALGVGLSVLVAFFGARLADPWNPYAIVLPVFALLVLCWGAAVGRGWCVPAAVAVGSFLVQTHVGSLIVVAGVLLVAMGFGLRRGTLRGSTTLVVTGAVVAAMWFPTFVEQFRNAPGNLGLLLDFASEGDRPMAGGGGLALAVRGLTAIPLGLPADGPGLAEHRPIAYAALTAQIGAVIWALSAARRRGRRDLAILCVVVLVGIGAALVSGISIRGSLWAHLVLWMAPIGVVAWTAVVLVLLDGGGERVASVALVVAVLVATVMVGSGLPGLEHGRGGGDSDTVRALSGPIVSVARGGGTVLVRIVHHDQWQVAAGLIVELVKADVPVHVEDGWTFMFGDRLRRTGEEASSIVVGHVDAAAELGSRAGMREVARADGTVVLLGDPGAP